MNISELKQQHSSLDSNMDGWVRHWDEVSIYVHPDIYDKWKILRNSPNVAPECLDPTARQANILLASSLNQSFTSPSMSWFKIRDLDSKLDKDREIREYYEDVERVLYSSFATSNFYQSMFTGWLAIPSYGTSCIFMDDYRGDGRIYTKNIPVFNIRIAENYDGIVDTIFVKYKFTAKQIVERWPKAKDNNQKISEAISKNPFEMFDVVHYVAPKNDSYTRLKDHKFLSIYYLDSDSDSQLNDEGEGFHEFPYFVDRWAVNPGDCYGLSPGLIALPTIKSLNKTIELKFEGLGMEVNRPILTTEKNILAIGDEGEIAPGVQIVVRDVNQIHPWVSANNMNFAEMSISEMQNEIRSIFHTNELLLAMDRPEMTAYEVSKRIEIMYKILGPSATRIERERLSPMIERAYGILNRSKKLPQKPSAGSKIDVEYTSPLARVQRMNEVQSVTELLQTLISIAQIDPMIIKKIDVSEFVDFIAERTGVPVKVLRDSNSYKKIIDAQNKSQEQEAMLEQMKTGAQAYQSFGRAEQALSRVQ